MKHDFDIFSLCKLSKIELSDHDSESFTSDIDCILSCISELNSVTVSNTLDNTDSFLTMREDIHNDTSAPKGGFFTVERVVK